MMRYTPLRETAMPPVLESEAELPGDVLLRGELGTLQDRMPQLLALHEWQKTARRRYLSQAWICFRLYDSADQVGIGAGCCDCFLLWLNRCYAEDYKHVELAFVAKSTTPGEPDMLFACTVDLPAPHAEGSGRVRMVERDRDRANTYNTDRWQCFQLHTFSEIEVLALYVYCMRQCGKPINVGGLYWNFLPLLRECSGTSQPEEEAYFCSQLMASALKWVRPTEYAWVTPRRCTPLQLYQALCKRRDMVESGEFRSAAVLSLHE